MITCPQPPTPNLGVIRCIITQPVLSDDWRRTTILTTNILINDKPCKILIDSGSCVNAISRNTINRTGLKPVSHPKPYNVCWIDTSLSIIERCQVSLKLAGYQDEVWCDVISMDAGSIILGRQWLYDLDVTLYERSNSCTFVYKGQKIRINPIEPK